MFFRPQANNQKIHMKNLGPSFAQILVSSPIECTWKVSEIRYNSMKLVITSQALIFEEYKQQ
jgi:hypothetical protein